MSSTMDKRSAAVASPVESALSSTVESALETLAALLMTLLTPVLLLAAAGLSIFKTLVSYVRTEIMSR